MFWADSSDTSHSPGAGILMLLLLVLFQCSILDSASLIGTVRDKIFAYQLRVTGSSVSASDWSGSVSPGF